MQKHSVLYAAYNKRQYTKIIIIMGRNMNNSQTDTEHQRMFSSSRCTFTVTFGPHLISVSVF